MDRRESLKALSIGTFSVGTLLSGCNTKENKEEQGIKKNDPEKYGRTPEEAERDAELREEQFFSEAELATITVLADIIIPKDSKSGSASEAKVPEFIEFIVKDQPNYQVPMRGGLRWLDSQSIKRFNNLFSKASKQQQIEFVDMIAYPEKAAPDMQPGVSFFNMMRNLTATGFFTSEMGIKDLDYKGNTPNEWDGVPQEVLKQYNLEYDAKTLAECLKDEERGKIMTWES